MTTPASTEPTTTEAAAPAETTTPPTTAPPTTEAVTTTTDPLAVARAAIEMFAGAYMGTWTNTTYGSTGPIVIDIALDGNDVVVDLDLGGFVFGQPDPDPESFRIPLSADFGSGAIETAVFGPVTTSVDAATGTITMSADAVPTPGIATFEATVKPTGLGTFGGTYVVTFDSGDTAEGVFEFSRE